LVVALVCIGLNSINALELTWHVNDEDQYVFDQDVALDGTEEITIKTSDKIAEVVIQSPFKTKVIPSIIFEKFPHLKSLTIKDVGLTTIWGHFFVNAKALTDLHIEGNDIGTLESNSFSAAKHLQSLDLSDNNITKIEYDAFAGLTELTKLSLHGNKVADFDIAKFAKFPKLDTLIVSDMDFTFSSPIDAVEMAKIVALNSSITTLHLSNNPIDTPDLWKRLSIFPNLETAYFTGTKFTHIDHMEEFKKLLPHLTALTMDENPFDSKWLEEAKTYFSKEEVHFRYD